MNRTRNKLSNPSVIRKPSNSKQLYFQHQIPNFQGLTKNSFPDESGKPIRCTSYGQALFSLPGSKLNSSDAANWFRVFYKGLDNPLYFPFTESESFENPTAFRLDNFADDNSTRHLYTLMIQPGFLPVGISPLIELSSQVMNLTNQS